MFNAIERRTHVKPSLPLRGTYWLPWHLPLSNHGVRLLLVRLFAPCMGLDGVFVTFFYYGFSACCGAATCNLAENLLVSTLPRRS
jgi:hypothetical protein